MGDEMIDRKLKELIESFENALTFEDRVKVLLEFAIRAPSTHNTQPWIFEIKKDSVLIHRNLKYRLFHADPKGRDMVISIGCATENLILAATYFGIFKKIQYRDDGVEMSEVFLLNTSFNNYKPELLPLLKGILAWKNTRGEFSEEDFDAQKILDNSDLDFIDSSDQIMYKIITDSKVISTIADLTSNAVTMAHNNNLFRVEMSNWMNTNISQKKDGIPGYSLRMPLILSFIIPVLIRWINMGSILAKKSGRAIKTAPTIFVVTAKSENHTSWMKVGRLAQRLMLLLQSSGLKTSIYVGAIEIETENKKLMKFFSKEDGAPQFLFATGKMDFVSRQTPRKLVKDKLKYTNE